MRSAVILLSLLLGLQAGQASAATAPKPTPRPAAARAVATKPAPAAPLGVSLAQGAGLPTTGLSGGLSSLPGLSGAPDPRPQCRADCANILYRCSPEDSGCDHRWTQCLTVCR